MKRILVFISAFALSTGVAYAMEEEAMDEEMMMEAPAPSVTLTGSGEMGFKNVDDAKDTGFQLIRAYKVAFSSSSVTDGGLTFGAGMSIRDDTGEEDMPVVKGSHVYVGSADGSWKLQFGGNDPGIEVVPGIGVADDNFGGGDADIALSGTMEGASYRLSMAAPGGSGDWSLGVAYSISDISVGVGLDSESGMAIGASTELSGLSTSFYYAKSELAVDDIDPKLMKFAGVAAVERKVVPSVELVPEVKEVLYSPEELYYSNHVNTLNKWAMSEAGKAVLVGDGSAGTPRTDRLVANYILDELNKYGMSDLSADEKGAISSFITATINGGHASVITGDNPATEAEEADWNGIVLMVDDPETEDVNEAVALSFADINKALDEVTMSIYSDDDEMNLRDGVELPDEDPMAVKVEGKDAIMSEEVVVEEGSDAIKANDNMRAGTSAYTGFGASVSVPAGEGTSFSIGYSTFKAETTAETLPATAMHYDGGDVTPYKGGQSVKTSLIELGVSYDLGGGATLGASIDKKTAESVMVSTENGARVGKVVESDTTTLEAAISFSF